MISLKIELEVAASKVIHQLQTHNEELQNAAEQGVKEAFEELAADENFKDLVKTKTKERFIYMLETTIASYETSSAIQKAINTALSKKIEEYAQKVAEKFTSQLE